MEMTQQKNVGYGHSEHEYESEQSNDKNRMDDEWMDYMNRWVEE